ncbi:MAG: DNA alkylation repair protein [Deltaproteobacteria bacterium]|nr:DNA alkylation repair protein [Deltaproteobacteria bacterium]
MSVLEELQGLAEKEYKAFNLKIIPTKQTPLGVRLPILRKIAKRIAKEDAIDFVKSDKQNIYEMILLEGMVLSYMNESFKELLPLTENFLNKVDNWAQVDSTICDFQKIESEKEDVLAVVKKWLNSHEEFFVRAGLVMLLAHFVEKQNLKMIFNLSQRVVHTGYYVHMGNAWLISCCMAKFPEETIVFFRNNTLDNRTHNKAIQKSRESFRVSKEHKAIINELKRTQRGYGK